jgi:PAS domain S-box-containing protein
MRSKKDELRQDLSLDVDRGHARLTDLEATMKAIYRGEVDGIAVDGPEGRRVFTLQNPEEPYRILAERMSEGIATLTCQGTILFCNRRMAEMAGLPAEQLLGSCFTAMLNEEVRQGFLESIRQALESDVRMEGCLLAENRSKLPVQLSLSSISLKECGQGICLVATDLSNQKRAEEEVRLRRERELRLKDQLLSHVSHELRSPLTSVHQFTTILLDGLSGPLNSEQRSDLEIVLKSANQLRVMIDDLLETARIEAGKIKIERGCVVLQDLVREAVQMLRATAAENRVTLRHDGQNEPYWYTPTPIVCWRFS